MNRKKEIAYDIWTIMRQVYGISDIVSKSEKQEEFIDKVVDYIDVNIGVRRKKKEKEECSKESAI